MTDTKVTPPTPAQARHLRMTGYEGTEAPAPKPAAKKSRDAMTPAEKAADTRARNRRREQREANAEAATAAEAPATSAGQRTWSCPQCGRGTTFDGDSQPPTILHCEGCGRDSAGDTWLPPGVGHGEPTLQTPRQVT